MKALKDLEWASSAQTGQTSKQGSSEFDRLHFAGFLTAEATDALLAIDRGFAVDEFNRFRRADHRAFPAADTKPAVRFGATDNVTS